MDAISIIIADDRIEYRQIYRRLLQGTGIEIISEATNGKELLSILAKRTPDIILLDIEMPELDGSTALDIIIGRNPTQKIIMLSIFNQNVLAENFISRGAKAYLSKNDVCAFNTLLRDTIIEVMNGKTIHRTASLSKKSDFTPRQKQILPKVFENKTNDQIAEELLITTRAVEKQRSKIYERTNSNSPLDFYKFAFSNGLQYLKDLFKSTKKT